MTTLEGTLKYIKTPLVLPKGSGLGLIQSPNSAANLQGIQKTEEHAELHQDSHISKTQTTGHSAG